MLPHSTLIPRLWSSTRGAVGDWNISAKGDLWRQNPWTPKRKAEKPKDQRGTAVSPQQEAWGRLAASRVVCMADTLWVALFLR